MTDETNSAPTRNPHIDSMFKQLSASQWRFVTAMVENPAFSKKDAAEYIGITADTVYRWPDYVSAAVDHARRDAHAAALSRRKQAVLKAIAVKVALLDSEDESIRSKAASEIIEWELGKATQRTEHTSDPNAPLTIRVVYDDEISDDSA